MICKADMYLMIALMKARSLFCDEKGEVNIVAIVVLIGIAVLLAVVFRKNIENLLESLFKTINGTANNAVGPGN